MEQETISGNFQDVLDGARSVISKYDELSERINNLCAQRERIIAEWDEAQEEKTLMERNALDIVSAAVGRYYKPIEHPGTIVFFFKNGGVTDMATIDTYTNSIACDSLDTHMAVEFLKSDYVECGLTKSEMFTILERISNAWRNVVDYGVMGNDARPAVNEQEDLADYKACLKKFSDFLVGKRLYIDDQDNGLITCVREPDIRQLRGDLFTICTEEYNDFACNVNRAHMEELYEGKTEFFVGYDDTTKERIKFRVE